MARYQIQSLQAGDEDWQDEPTDAYARSDYCIAISAAELLRANAKLYREAILVRIVKVGRWTGRIKAEVWRR